MARRRFISCAIWTNHRFVSVSHGARLTFLGAVTLADDEGRLTGNTKELRLMIFPGDRVTDGKVDSWKSELASVDLLRPYQVDGKDYIEVPRFQQHQDSRYRTPSDIPQRINMLADSAGNGRIRQHVYDHVYDHDHEVHTVAAQDAAPRNGFDSFWNEYPKKRAKGDALKAWKALKPDATLTARIVTAVRSQRESADWRKAQGRYIPYPATWLRDQRWDDVPDVPRASALDELEGM